MNQNISMRKAYSYIRMSTETQLKGDSLRRQLDASAAYAKQNNLQIVDSIDGTPFKDIGVSAYRGLNAQEGALGVFLRALQDGKIEPDSVLLVENLDRLSRDRTLVAFSQFTAILNAGIEVVTISDNQRYTKETMNANIGQLFITLGTMFRANEESEIKSKRVRSAWEQKRKNASSKVLTRVCPGWLKYNEETGKFDSIDERVKIVKLVFKLCIESCGLYAIAKLLNGKKVPVFGSAKHWHRSYIKKLLSNRAVLGEYQPHHAVEGKRQPIGDPVFEYYPRIIDEQTYLLANAALTRRDVSAKGRKGTHFSNLLTGLVYCGACGSKMTLRNRGATPKGGKSFCCASKLVGAGCDRPDWKMSEVEQSIFQHLREVDFTSLLNNEASKAHDLKLEIEALNAKLASKNQAASRASELLVTTELSADAKNRIIAQLNEIEVEILGTKEELARKEFELSDETEMQQTLSGSELKQMIELLESNKEDYILRASVNQLLSKSIDRIDLREKLDGMYPWEFENDDAEVVAFRKASPEFAQANLTDLVNRKDFQTFAKQFQRHISIRYKTGAVRHIVGGYNISSLRKPLRSQAT